MAGLQRRANDAMEHLSQLVMHASEEPLDYDGIFQVIEGWKLVDA
jgi:hypothetical protein